MSEDDGSPLFPAKLYLYREDGFYDPPITIESVEDMAGPGVRLLIKTQIDLKLQLRITDPSDRIILHAVNGKIVWPPEEARKAAREKAREILRSLT